MLLQILYHGIKPLLDVGVEFSAAAQAEFCRQRAGKPRDFCVTKRQAMVRARTSHRRRGLDNVQATHLGTHAICLGGFVKLAPAVKFPHVTDVARPADEKIGVERKNDVGVLRTIDRVDVSSESELCALARAIPNGRFPLVPLG